MKPLYIGLVVAGLATIIGILFNDLQLACTITSWLGIILLALAMLLSGTFVSGDRMRANQASETKEMKQNRHNTTIYFLTIAIPNFITSIILYLFFL